MARGRREQEDVHAALAIGLAVRGRYRPTAGGDRALEAGVAPRHLSYVETGKAQPSRDLVMRLADALEMPLRERNTLLTRAGYAPKYAETELETPVMAQVRRAIELILDKQEPYPAFLLDRHWDVVMENRAAARIDEFLLPGGALSSNARS